MNTVTQHNIYRPSLCWLLEGYLTAKSYLKTITEGTENEIYSESRGLLTYEILVFVKASDTTFSTEEYIWSSIHWSYILAYIFFCMNRYNFKYCVLVRSMKWLGEGLIFKIILCFLAVEPFGGPWGIKWRASCHLLMLAPNAGPTPPSHPAKSVIFHVSTQQTLNFTKFYCHCLFFHIICPCGLCCVNIQLMLFK